MFCGAASRSLSPKREQPGSAIKITSNSTRASALDERSWGNKKREMLVQEIESSISLNLKSFSGEPIDTQAIRSDYIVIYKGGFGSFFHLYNELREVLKGHKMTFVFAEL